MPLGSAHCRQNSLFCDFLKIFIHSMETFEVRTHRQRWEKSSLSGLSQGWPLMRSTATRWDQKAKVLSQRDHLLMLCSFIKHQTPKGRTKTKLSRPKYCDDRREHRRSAVEDHEIRYLSGARKRLTLTIPKTSCFMMRAKCFQIACVTPRRLLAAAQTTSSLRTVDRAENERNHTESTANLPPKSIKNCKQRLA